MKAAGIVVEGAERLADADLHLVAGDDGRQGGGTVRTRHLGRRQRRRHDRRAGMQRGSGVGVVEIERMGEGAVDQGGSGRRIAGRITNHAGAAAGKAEACDGGEQARGRFRIVAGAQRNAGDVEHQQLGALRDFRGKAVIAHACRVLGQFCANHDPLLPWLPVGTGCQAAVDG